MARRRRIGVIDIPQHVIHRGNNRNICFADQQDFSAYVKWLKQYSQEYSVAIHAWVFMTNHIHLLCTPKNAHHSVSIMMQSIGRQYVRYFNDKYRRTGTLWEGRFKSTLVNAPDYLLQLYQYIELNPVRAQMVSDPANYKWSSYQINALGKHSSLIEPHPLYTQLGTNKCQRLIAYRRLFEHQLEQGLIDDIRHCSQKEIVLGNSRFKQQVAELTGIELKSATRGRPKVSEKHPTKYMIN